METTAKIKLLLVAAEPMTGLDEGSLLLKRLNNEPCNNSYVLQSVRALNPAEVVAADADMRPDVIHFCGECPASGNFVFKNDDGSTSDWCSKSNLLKKLSRALDDVKLVYFNGAVKDSELAAAGGKIAFLVGMQQRGETEISKKFAGGFYMALGFGNSVGFSFGKVWQALPEGERKLVLRFRNDIDQDKYCLRDVGVPRRSPSTLN